MSDSLSHSCPTCPECKGKGVLGGCGSPTCDHTHTFMFCPSCLGGYPREAVERAAKAIEDTVKAHVMPSRLTGGEVAPGMFFGATMQELALAAIRAFHNEGTDT